MKSKITQRLRQIGGILLILVGCVGMWGKYTFSAVAVLLTGFSFLPSTLVLLPPKQKALPEFAGHDDSPTFVYDSKGGKRYHYKQKCAGENARRSRIKNIDTTQCTPCQICCK